MILHQALKYQLILNEFVVSDEEYTDFKFLKIHDVGHKIDKRTQQKTFYHAKKMLMHYGQFLMF